MDDDGYFDVVVEIYQGYAAEQLKRLQEFDAQINTLKEQKKAYQESIIDHWQTAWCQHVDLPEVTEQDIKEEQRVFAFAYYWFTPSVLTSEQIARAINVEPHKLLPFINRDAWITLQCPTCGTEIEVRVKTKNKANFAKRYPVTCPDCDNAQNEKRRTAIEQYKARIRELKTMPYRTYLQTEEWAKIRTRKLRRAGFACELCHDKGTLNVHHKTYERRGEEMDSDLIVLCLNCHAKFHDKLPESKS